MTQFVIIGLCVVSVTVLTTGNPTCGPNEILNNCPSNCGTQYCPKSENYDRTCIVPDANSCPPSACECIFNYRRAENGTCIPTTSCPKFDCKSHPKTEYVACSQYCPTDDCSQATPDGRCPYPGILPVVECHPTCRCIKGYWRKNGICVPFDQC